MHSGFVKGELDFFFLHPIDSDEFFFFSLAF